MSLFSHFSTEGPSCIRLYRRNSPKPNNVMHCVSTKATDYYQLTLLRLSDTSFAELPKLSEVEDLLPRVGVVDLLDLPLPLPILGTGAPSQRLWQGV